MSDSPIIDVAIRAGCEAHECIYPTCMHSNPVCQRHLLTLRAALPWQPPLERLQATIKAGCLGGRVNCRYPSCGCQTYPNTVIAAYDNDPIMLELYHENGTPR